MTHFVMPDLWERSTRGNVIANCWRINVELYEQGVIIKCTLQFWNTDSSEYELKICPPTEACLVHAHFLTSILQM